MTVGKGATSLVGEALPGGRKARFDGDSARVVAGVVGRDVLDVGRIGGGIELSLLTKLVLLGIGDGHGDTCDNVSVVRSDNDGRGLRFSGTP